MKILFAEDTSSWIEMFLPQLKELGEVVVVKNGGQAIRDMCTQKFDIIICDHYMPMGCGDEVYNSKFDTLNKDTPFLSFSSMVDLNNYIGWEDDPNFHIMTKQYGAELLEFIKEILGVKK